MASPVLVPTQTLFRRMPHPEGGRPVSGRGLPGETSPRAVAVAVAPPPFPALPDERAAQDGAVRYGARSGPSWGALTVVLLLHAALVGAVMTARMVVARKAPPPVLNTFTVMPEPPAAAPPPPAPAAPLAGKAATPRDALAAPVPAVAVPGPGPASASVAHSEAGPAARAVSAAAPAPSTAAPAPITPPDFSAGQLRNGGPAYPYLSRRAKEEGVVTLRVLVTEEGRAGEVRVDRSSGFERLDKAALATVKHWKFLPARQAGRAIAAWVLVPVTFALD